ncbi:MAG: malonyl-ACP O-methyltransferase [Magnetococcales bacterium]|nr:malonyl-ACP O-methyltransferase [Magnetococcales bacterium]
MRQPKIKKSPRSATIAAAFDRADAYHQAAETQKEIARRLDQRLAGLPLTVDAPNTLEIGCGTGFLSRKMVERYPEGDHLLTDIAPAMLSRCRNNLDHLPGRIRYAVMNGERPVLPRRYHLIISSMAFQWFENLPGALQRLAEHLEPGGRLLFSTLGDGAFAEWRRFCTDHSLPFGRPDYPTRTELKALWPQDGKGVTEEEHLRITQPSALDFLRHLKQIGAHPSGPNHQPAESGKLRAALRHTHPEGFEVTYHVLYGMFQKSPA